MSRRRAAVDHLKGNYIQCASEVDEPERQGGSYDSRSESATALTIVGVGRRQTGQGIGFARTRQAREIMVPGVVQFPPEPHLEQVMIQVLEASLATEVWTGGVISLWKLVSKWRVSSQKCRLVGGCW